MKYIITESQKLQLRKIKFLKDYIKELLSKYEWFNGDVNINVSTWVNSGKVYPLYEILLDTGGRSYHSYDEGEEIEDRIDTMFTLLFPKDENNRPTSVWDVAFV
jgi:predicted heme/steroid binding protein